MTWGYKDGWPDGGYDSYQSMQDALTQSHMEIADELGLPIAPVGIAWQIAHEQHPEIELWAEDGGHPTPASMFLAANVFYALFFREDPTELPFVDEFSVDEATAQILQQIAAQVVLEDPAAWNLP
jgi:hypothetical protein